MATFRINRISGDVQKELIEAMKHIKDPRVSASLISIVRVDVTNDLSFANVYVSSLDGIESAKKAIEGLNSAKGFIKREISKKIKLRKVPEFIFIPNDSIEYSANISEMLRKLEDK